MTLWQRTKLAGSLLWRGQKDAFWQEFFTGPWRSGGGSTPNDPYKNVWIVYACVRAISLAISQVPFRIGIQDKKGEIKEDIDRTHPLMLTLANPNPFDTWSQLIQQTMALLETTGACFWTSPDFQPLGKPRPAGQRLTGIGQQFVARSPKGWSVDANNKKEALGWKFRGQSGRAKHFKFNEVLWFHYPDPKNSTKWLSPLDAAMQSIKSEWAAGRYNTALLNNNATPAGLLSGDADVDDKQAKQWMRRWGTLFGGPDNANKIAVIGKGMKFETVAQTMTEMGFSELKSMSREEIAAVFGVPPLILWNLKSAPKANAQAQLHLWLHMNLAPKMTMVAQVFDSWAKRYDSRFESYFATDSTPLFAQDHQILSATAQTYFNIGIPRNEIISALGLPFDEVPAGDAAFLPIGLIPVSGAGETIPEREAAPEKTLTTTLDNVRFHATSRRQHAAWLGFYRNVLRPNEAKIERKVSRWYNDTRGKYLRAVDAAFPSVERGLALNKGMVDMLLPDSIDDDELAEMVKPLYGDTFNDSLEQLNRELGGVVTFGIPDPRIAEALKTLSHKLQSVPTETEEAIRATLQEGLIEGEDVLQLKNRIRGWFNEQQSFRAMRIARTEASAAGNWARYEGLEQGAAAGAYERHAWVTAADGDVRESHAAQDGYPVPLGEPFPNGLTRPHDPMGDPGETVNCRCTTVAVVE